MDTVDVVVVSYGSFDHWRSLADRAVASLRNQTVPPTNIWCSHFDGNNHELPLLRNAGVRLSDAEWLIFLDADDELDSHYIEEMLKGQGDIRQPSTLGVVNGKEDDYPVLIPPHPGGFLVGNHLVIGCMVRRKLFLDVGGFRNLPILEDWDLWIRCILYDGKVGTVPKAIYRVHVNPNSRNQQDGHGKTYTEIQGLYINEWRAKGFK